MSDYPRTIDNGHGERLTFSEIRSDERGEYQEATNSVAPGRAGSGRAARS